MFDSRDEAFDSKEDVDLPGLRYVSDDRPGNRRKRAGKGFLYIGSDGKRISEVSVLTRLRTLAIPSAWTDVWICPFAVGHIQATGRDAEGRKQYCYHASYREMQEGVKYERLLAFANVLPTIRAKVAEHMALRGLPQLKVVATVVHLLETTLIRVGNDDYARQNKSYGLTTLKNRHVAIEGSEIRFRFIGKSGKQWSLKIRDRRIAKIIRACQELPGQELLQYRDEDGELRAVTSSDVNAYLREVSGRDVTAKDFRTWAGTMLTARILGEMEKFETAVQAKRNLRAAIESVSVRLGNTPTICRKSYIHPEVPVAYLDGSLFVEAKSDIEAVGPGAAADLLPEELALLAMLRARSK
jgi:DNA topoisomerase-1